jgi:hypothetical protein
MGYLTTCFLVDALVAVPMDETENVDHLPFAMKSFQNTATW